MIHNAEDELEVAFLTTKQVLLITQCQDSLKWYSDLIGKHVPLHDVETTEYKSREPSGYINFVSLDDAKIVDVENYSKFYFY